jgi:hypothetical protein
LNNKSKINTSKGKTVLAVVGLAAILMLSLNLNANMNSKMMAYATILGNLESADDVGQSLECVIVVVGCDGTGSVGSSGDTIIGSNNGNDDNNSSSTDGNTPLPPLTNCDECIGALDPAVQASIAAALDLPVGATVADICVALGALATVGALVEVLSEAGLTAQAIVDLLACLDIDISLAEVIAIIGL